MQKEKVKMDIINHHAAGIDVGSRSHYVAVGQGSKDVKEFGVYNEDLLALVKHLQDHGIKTVAMESTGTYWQSLYSMIEQGGIDIILCNGKFTKNIKGKKTDVQDCQWIQKLHTLGLLTGSFLPDIETEKLRTLCRHRLNLIDMNATIIKKMQKYLRLLNLRLDVVVNDIAGLTGMKIIAAICDGEIDPEKLASFRNGNCRKSEEEIAKALHSNGRKDYLFALQQEYESFQFILSKIKLCDDQIEKTIQNYLDHNEDKKQYIVAPKPHKRISKNAPKNIDLNAIAYQFFDGVDLMAIEGINSATVMTILSEIGVEGFKKFDTAKQFASWLRLSPNTKKTGGKVISTRIPKGSNRLKIALRNAANVIGNLKDTHLSNFFKRISNRKGRTSAISATARKLSVIIWNMIVKRIPYKPEQEYLFLDQKRKLKLVSRLKKQSLNLN